MPDLKLKVISSLEKCLWGDSIDSKPEKKDFVMLKNERLSFQVAYYNAAVESVVPQCRVAWEGELAKYASVKQVVSVPVMYPGRYGDSGGEYISRDPGLYPDLIRPLHYNGCAMTPSNQLHALWVEIELPEDFAGGDYTFTLTLLSEKNEALASASANIHVVEAQLPAQKLIHTEWFYTDCIAQYYHVKAFSEKHWKLIKNFMKTAVRNGVNMIFTPVFTPELDTYIGGERLTTQLVGIEVLDDGSYKFDFSALERWINLALECGFEYFEIPHFFTQWGAKNAPKIVAKKNGRTKRIFGWETDAMGEEYDRFLSSFIPALINCFKAHGLDKKCYFHVSDEPRLSDMEQYTRCKNIIGKHLEGYHIIDALSNYEFYTSGALKKPIPKTRHMAPFIENNVEGLWTYYCGSGGVESNRFIAQPTARTRIIGVQLYLYKIEGFLHWGYNFYNNRRSYDVLDPFGYTDGEFFAPSGDMYVVYPGDDGTAWESIRLNAMREAVDDIRALELYESKFGREATEKLILEGTDGTLTFLHYPTDPAYILNLREKIAKALEA